MQSYSYAVRFSNLKKFPSIRSCNFFSTGRAARNFGGQWSFWSNVVGDSAAESWSLYAQLGREIGGWKLGRIFNLTQLKTWNREIWRKLSQGLAGLLVGGGLGATAGTISLLGFKPELRTQMIWWKIETHKTPETQTLTKKEKTMQKKRFQVTRMKKCVLWVLIIKDLPSFLQDEASPCYCPSSSILCWIRFGPCTGGAEHSEIFAFAAFTSGERINRNESDLVWQNFQVSKRTDVSWSLAHGAGTALEVSPTLRARCQGLIRFQKERTCRTFQDTHVGIQSSDRLKLSLWGKHCFFALYLHIDLSVFWGGVATLIVFSRVQYFVRVWNLCDKKDTRVTRLGTHVRIPSASRDKLWSQQPKLSRVCIVQHPSTCFESCAAEK